MVQYFVSKYIHGKNVSPPEAETNSEAKSGRKPPRPQPNWSGSIDSICDIEENIWSPWLGIKGRVDLTVKVYICLNSFIPLLTILDSFCKGERQAAWID